MMNGVPIGEIPAGVISSFHTVYSGSPVEMPSGKAQIILDKNFQQHLYAERRRMARMETGARGLN
jgi:hypothetical protein